MDEHKENPELENLKEKMEEFGKSVSEKAEELKGKAENMAGKTMDAAEKLINDVFKKNTTEDADFTEEKVDPKDIEIAELKKEMDELRDKYVRLYADFDNHRKRTAKEKLELIQTASKEVIKDMLPVLDDFERAIKAMESSSDFENAKNGMHLIHNKLQSTLTAKGLKAMSSVGADFDVELHEAITEIPVPAETAGKVVDEVEKGYYLNDKIIRFAKVVVGKSA